MDLIPLAVGLASTAFRVVRNIQEARQAEAVAKANAEAARISASTALQQNAAESFIERLRAREAVGEQRAQLARSGIELGAGSADFLTKTTERNLQFQSDLREASRISDALGLLHQAARLRNQAKAFAGSVPTTILGGAIQAGEDIVAFGQKRGFFK